MSFTPSFSPSPQQCPRTLSTTIQASNPVPMAHTRYHPAVVGVMRLSRKVGSRYQGQHRVRKTATSFSLDHSLPSGLSMTESISVQISAGYRSNRRCTTHSLKFIQVNPWTSIPARIRPFLLHIHSAGTTALLITPTLPSEAHRYHLRRVRRSRIAGLGYQGHHRVRGTPTALNPSGLSMMEHMSAQTPAG